MRKCVCVVLLALLSGFAVAGFSAPGDTKSADQENPAPPEMTSVSGRLMLDGKGVTGGVAYFVYEKRLSELPQENPMEKIRAMAETAVAVDQEGSFTLNMAPGNYALVYDPKATASANELKPGTESFAMSKRPTREQVKARIEAIKKNVEVGLPIKQGKIGDAYVVENRVVRPPVTEFGETDLGADHSVTVLAEGTDGKLVDYPVSLHLRGRNGDVFEPHPPSRSESGKFVFENVFPQEYEVYATATKPKPGSGDTATTPTIKNGAFTFEGTPKEVKVTVGPASQDSDEAPPAKKAPVSRKRL